MRRCFDIGSFAADLPVQSHVVVYMETPGRFPVKVCDTRKNPDDFTPDIAYSVIKDFRERKTYIEILI